jgi:DtxR family Mn-dependent transcriptional regulator
MVTISKENYLQVIFHLYTEFGTATTVNIAKHLHISPSSVSERLQSLHHEGLVNYSPYKGASLTPKGRNIAIDVVRRHRLSERFLQDILGLKWDQVHHEAKKIEHVLSKIVSDRLDKVLGRPKTCPHGNPVPDTKGHIKEEQSYPLISLHKNDHVKIIKIVDEDPKLLNYLATLGLMPKVKISIEEKTSSGPIIIKVGNSSYALGKNIAESIWVKKI